MGKRKMTPVQVLWPQVKAMRNAGKSRQEIMEALELSSIKILDNLIYREQSREREEAAYAKRIHRRRRPVTEVEKLEKENEELRMEVDLLQAFHREVGRGRQ